MRTEDNKQVDSSGLQMFHLPWVEKSFRLRVQGYALIFYFLPEALFRTRKRVEATDGHEIHPDISKLAVINILRKKFEGLLEESGTGMQKIL